MTIEQAIDEVQIAGSAASGADRKLPCYMRLTTGREGRDLLVPHMDPIDLAPAADRIGQAIQAVADDTIDSLHAGCGEGFCKLIGHCFGHDDLCVLV